MSDLFDIPESEPDELTKARADLKRALARLFELEDLVDNQGPEAGPLRDEALQKAKQAESHLRTIELKRLNR